MPNHANVIYYFIYSFAWNAFIFYSYSHSTHGPFRFNSKKKKRWKRRPDTRRFVRSNWYEYRVVNASATPSSSHRHCLCRIHDRLIHAWLSQLSQRTIEKVNFGTPNANESWIDSTSSTSSELRKTSLCLPSTRCLPFVSHSYSVFANSPIMDMKIFF